MSLRKRIERVLVLALIAAAALAFAPINASATHYPDGSKCYDCHAVSGSKMVSGTNMIKMSPFIAQIQAAGWTTADTLPCVFCHRKDVVSVATVTKMKPVDAHFGSSVASKHDANFASTFTTTSSGGGGTFNCNDCHPNASISSPVTYDGGTGDANVHGVDAKTVTIDVYTTLRTNGSVATAANKKNHCLSATCHGSATDINLAGRIAKKAHGYSTTTAGTGDADDKGTAMDDCSDCHATHRGEKQTGLMVLLTDGTIDAQDGTSYAAAQYVTPNKCDSCHTQKKGTGTLNDFTTRGHGRSDISGGSFTCTACHNEALPHSFATGGSTANPLRFKYSIDATKTSDIRKDDKHKSAYSICLTCHATQAGKVHGTANVAGCNDCHETHGTTVGSNTTMIRGLVPKLNTTGTAVYEYTATSYQTLTYTSPTDAYRADGAGICDNAECHKGRVFDTVNTPGTTTTAIWPLSTFMAGTYHSRGSAAPGSACETCHTHSDSNGSWGGAQACNTCHGYPPTTNSHTAHAVDAGYPCETCHPDPGGVNHNTFVYTPIINDLASFATVYGSNRQAIRNQVELDFTGSSVYTGIGSYSIAKGSRDNSTYGTCSTACHGGALNTILVAAGDQGTTPPTWGTPATGECGDCHKGPAINPFTGSTTSHVLHTTAQLNHGAIGCENCHINSYNGSATVSAAHVNGKNDNSGSNADIAPDATALFNNATVSFSYNAVSKTCSANACHGTFANTVWNAAPATCANCHATFGATGTTAMPATVQPKHSGALVYNGASKMYNSHKASATGTGKGEEYCDFCHANTQAAYVNGAPNSWDSAKHMNGTIEINSNGAYAGSSGGVRGGAGSGCASNCHTGSTSEHLMTDTGRALDTTIVGASLPCGSCHTAGVTSSAASGAHTKHLAGSAYMVSGGANCIACHGGSNYTSSGPVTHMNGTLNFATVTYSAARGTLTGTCTTATCHNRGTGATVSAAWNVTGLACDACHYYAASPTAAGDATFRANNRGALSVSHDDHFTNNAKTCTQCHAATTDFTHINGSAMSDRAVAVIGEASVDFTNAAALTDYTYNNVERSCYTPTNNGLGCHASAGAAGAGDATRPDWDVAFSSCITNCHTDTSTAGVNPTSGLHGVTPLVSGQAHNNTVAGGCATCHAVTALATHANGTFSGSGAVAGDRTNMGLGTWYTNIADNSGTCINTAGVSVGNCHPKSVTIKEDDWAHEWPATPSDAISNTLSCNGCHGLGNTNTAWNVGVIHKTSTTMTTQHGGTGTYECKDCHGLEATAGTYIFTFSTRDWFFVDAQSKHGNGTIEVNNNGFTYNQTTNLCGPVCHTSSDGTHNFVDTTQAIAYITADTAAAGACGSCHTTGVNPTTATGAHAKHLSGSANLAAPGTPCIECHGNNGGSNYANSTIGAHGNGTLNMVATMTYSAARGTVTGTCVTQLCHNRGTGAVQSTAWNATVTGLPCDACHYYEATPSAANDTTFRNNSRGGLSQTHDDHFTKSKACTQCHGTLPTTSAHINGTTNQDRAVAMVGEAGLVWTHASALTDYTYNTTTHVCSAPTNSGLGCHATAATADWDVAFSDCISNCHTDTSTAGVNPTSGLHGVTPSVTGQAHNNTVVGGCGTCHAVSALGTHQNGAFTGNGSVPGDRTNMGLGTWYTNIADNSGTCINTQFINAQCHIKSITIKEDDWAHEWAATPSDATNNTLSCNGCHGLGNNNTAWNVGVIHRTSTAMSNTHGGTGTYECKDCHGLEATAGTYVFTFSTRDWYFADTLSKHGNGTIELNSSGVVYNQTTNLCTNCHLTSDGTHNFVDTTQAITMIAADTVTTPCGSCHTTGGVSTSAASGAHAKHLSGSANLGAPGTPCIECHGNNGGSNYGNSALGLHGNGTLNMAATLTYSAARGTVTGTCVTQLCHNRGTGAVQSTAWNATVTGLPCDACHYYEATPSAANDTSFRTNSRGGLSQSHDDHFTRSKACTQCHGTLPTTSAHVNGTTNQDRAVAMVGEAGLVWTDASAATDYTYNTTTHVCSAPTNSGLGCHATAATADWDVAFSDCISNCHTDTTTAGVNPTSGLHGVTPLVSGQAHNNTVAGGCGTCHAVSALGTHQNGAFTGNGSVPGDRTNMGLGTWYTNIADNSGTCINTAGVSVGNCHPKSVTIKEDDWAHEWPATPSDSISNTLSCNGCHGLGNTNTAWNVGVIHKTSTTMTTQHGGTGTYECKDCHGLEAVAGTYTFTFSTRDWFFVDAQSKHGNGTIELNSNGFTYNETTNLCGPVCHTTSDGTHNFVDTTQSIAYITADTVAGGSCGSCHATGVTPATATGAHTKHLSGTAALVAPGTPCIECHGNNGGSNYANSTIGAHGNGTLNMVATLTYSAARGTVTGTCVTQLCHNRGTGAVQSTAWNATVTGLPCDACHYYEATPSAANDTSFRTNSRGGLSQSHDDHFTRSKACTQCHGTLPTTSAHVNGTTNQDRAVAMVGEAGLVWTHASALTDYTYNTTTHVCSAPTNSGLGCHATGAAQDWDVAFSDCVSNCHTNTTTTATNPTSGLHGVTPSVSGQAHNNTMAGGCVTCHAVTALGSHQDGTFQGNSQTQFANLGLGTWYTSIADNSGTCINTAGVSVGNCHPKTLTIKEDDWAHEWPATPSDATNNTLACNGCHGLGNTNTAWNVGVIHRTSTNMITKHGGTGTYECKDCHGLEATAGTYTFTFSTRDWYFADTLSKHGNGTIELNSTGNVYNQTTNLCTTCHLASDGTHNFVDTTQAIATIAADTITISCGECHTSGVKPGAPGIATGAHIKHLSSTAALVAPGTPCIECHGNNGGSNYANATTGAHGNGTLNFATTMTYSAARGTITGTCTTQLCHNRGTGAIASTAWNLTGVACDQCHYWAATPTAAGDATFRTNNRGALSATHDDHFTRSKTCTQCHGALPTNTTHVSGTTNQDKASAVVGEASVVWTDASAVTDYTYNTTTHVCSAATNSGLGCHATGSPDWDLTITDCITSCHTDTTTAASNPTSGLHGVTPSVSGQAHNNTVVGGCATCHAVTALGTHQNGAFTGNGSVPGDRTNMGLGTWYTNIADNSGTCVNTQTVNAQCHIKSITIKEDDWAHKWFAAPTDATNNTLSCNGCHGLGSTNANWNSGVIHRTSTNMITKHGGTGTYECKDCHGLEATAGTYTFTFSTRDWYFADTLSKHGNGTIELNSNGNVYNQTTNLCTTCHLASDGTHNFVDTTQSIATIAADTITIACGECHSSGVKPGAPGIATGAHIKHLSSTAALTAGGYICAECHGNNGGSNYANSTTGAHGNGTLNFAATMTYSAARGTITGTCTTQLCHNRGTGAPASTAWNLTGVACDQCHYWAATPTAAGDDTFRTNNRGALSVSHDDHFNRSKTCTQCHGTLPTNTTHVQGTTNINKATASTGEATIDFTNAAAVTDYTYNTTDKTCSAATNNGLGCHATGTPDWDLSFTDCAQYCHTTTLNLNVNPASGLHRVTPLVSGVQHSNSMAGGCGTCHAVSALGTHQDGAFQGNSTTQFANLGLGTWYTALADNSGTCIGTNTVSAGNCHPKSPTTSEDDWAHKWMATSSDYTNSTNSCNGCHGVGSANNLWNAGVVHRTSSAMTSSHGGTGTYKCRDCHGLGGAAYVFTFDTNDWGGTSKHGNGSVEVNSNGVTYNPTTGLCGSCHTGSDGTHNFVDSTQNIVNLSMDPVNIACTGCHNPSATTGAQRVNGSSSHLKVTRAGTFGLCTDCHPGNLRGTKHSDVAASGVVGIANWTQIGIWYDNAKNSNYGTGTYNGIVLGGDYTYVNATSEAEICWRCHFGPAYDASDISEWGTNFDSNATFANYNFGTLSGGTFPGDWVTANWASANFTYKNGKLMDKPKFSAATGTGSTVVTNGGSIHSVNTVQTVVGAAGLWSSGGSTEAGARNLIRCSYCHDVHGAFTATKYTGGKSPGTKPWVRGTWMGSPYLEDGAPQSGTTYITGVNSFGAVPRGGSANKTIGGYQIDQNQGFSSGTYLNATTWGHNNSAGLCALCHAGVGQTWTTGVGGNVLTINQFGTATTDWGNGRTGSQNGHANSVLGGDAGTTYAANIYQEVYRHASGAPYTGLAAINTSAYRGAPLIQQRQVSATSDGGSPYAYSFRSDSGRTEGFTRAPYAPDARPWASNKSFGLTVDSTTLQAGYHKFTCSKCHNPHASRLPRLLITNCLDTRLNTWDDSYATLNPAQTANGTTPAEPNGNTQISQWTSANNCHRRKSSWPGGGTSTATYKTWTGAQTNGTDGWNQLTPWWP